MNINTDYTIRLGNRNIVKIMKGSTVIWEKSTTPVVTPDYFYIENAYNGSNTISISSTNKGSTGTWASSLQYSKDKSTWTTVSLADDNNPVTISMNSGEKVFFRNNNGYFNCITSGYNRITTFNCNKDFNVGGNINTLLNYQDVTNVSLSECCFYDLLTEDIRYSTHLKDASNLILPAMTLANSCYSGMFSGCTSLTTPPSLPATTLARGCYSSMFSNCWSLTSAPALPATTLAFNCYGSMFNECLALTTAPELPATTLAEQCYYGMFSGCSSLNSVTTYANDISASYCLQIWLQSVASSGTFYNNGSATYTKNSASGIPQGWTEVKPVNADYLYLENVDNKSGNVSFKFNGTPSSDTIQQIEWSKDKTNWTTVTLTANLTNNVPLNIGEKVYFRNSNGKCSQGSSAFLNFNSDINTNTGGELYTLLDYTNENVSLPTNYVFSSLFNNMNKLIDASGLVLRWTTLTDYCYSNMFQGCSSLTTVPSLPATTLANHCYGAMFSNCTSLTTAPSLPATTLADRCYETMFSGCTSLTTVQSLPATTLATSCYDNMFQGCSSLTTAPSLPATTLATTCYAAMFSRCTSLTTAPTLPSTTLATACYASMFIGCSSLTTAPTLPAITLVVNCYRNMFKSCSSLNSVTTYADDISASNCLTDWLNSVAATGTFYNNGNATYTIGFSGIPSGWTEVKPSTPSTGPDYFYLENVDSNSGNVSFKFNGTPSSNTIQQLEWSKDKTNWTSVTLVANTTTNVPVSVGEKVYFRNDSGKFSSNYNLYFTFGGDVLHDVGGDVNTLLDYTTDTTTLSIKYIFSRLFLNDTKLRNADNLTLGYTTVTDCCYMSMFNGCTSLTTAPALPATTLTKSACYNGMFKGCTSLTTAPSLPATTLGQTSYSGMFQGCTSLTTAPALPATTLAYSCYNAMFQGCTSLTTAPVLPATTLAADCYTQMFKGCSNLTTAPALPATTLADSCYRNMFQGCTSLTTAPALPATTVTDSCYNAMFNGCTSLTTAPSLPATTLADRCYETMFSGCTSLTTAPALPATTLATGCYRNMFQDCTSLNSVTTYANDISASRCLTDWLKSVASTGTLWNKGTATYPKSSASGIPRGWVELY